MNCCSVRLLICMSVIPPQCWTSLYFCSGKGGGEQLITDVQGNECQ